MWDFLSANWVWVLLIGGMLMMHLRHGGGHGGHGGCGGHHNPGAGADTPDQTATDEQKDRFA